MKCFNYGRRKAKGKAILVPYPAQGHVTPMLNLAAQLVNEGLEAILVTPEFIHCRILSQINPSDGIIFMSIPDGLEQGKPIDFFAIENAMENYMPFHLRNLIIQLQLQQQEEEDGCQGGVSCLIFDLLASYALDVANRCGVVVAGFWPAMFATYQLIAAIPKMLDSGFISQTGYAVDDTSMFSLPGVVEIPISGEELPWLIGTSATTKSRFKFWSRTMERSNTLRYLIVNSFPEECNAANVSGMQQVVIPLIQPPSALGIIRSMRLKASFWEEDLSCLDWLDRQTAGSVVYVSFGSWVSPIGEAKVKSIAMGLEASGKPFLWVLGNEWREGLPRGYIETSKLGKIVSWAPQIDVLQHEAVGCFLTHCGWNSTMEAIHCHKPLLCCPVAGDQFLNCAYIVKVWGIGVRIKGFRQRDVEEGLKIVMEDYCCEMRKRIMKLKEKLMMSHRAIYHSLTTFLRCLPIKQSN